MSPLALHQGIKVWLRRSGMSDEGLHIHLGIALWLAFAALFGTGLDSSSPLLALIALEVINETFDRLRKGNWRWHETLPDFLRTVFWPTLIFVFLRY